MLRITHVDDSRTPDEIAAQPERSLTQHATADIVGPCGGSVDDGSAQATDIPTPRDILQATADALERSIRARSRVEWFRG